MGRVITLAWLGLCGCAWAFSPSSAIRETYQFRRFSNNPALIQHSFGLNFRQREAIYEVTGGEVDLRYHYYREQFIQSLLTILSPTNFRGFIRFDVPPPVVAFPLGDSDPEAKNQYWLDEIRALEASSLATGKGVTIVDCDAGYHVDEGDIRPNLLMEHRYNLADPDSPFDVSEGPWTMHGTAVTAIMAAVKDGKGTQGIAYDAKIIPMQISTFSDRDTIDKEEATTRCILRALTIQRARVIVLENQTATGSSETFPGTREAVKLAMKAGITIVSAAGNYSMELLTEATENTDSIIVGALTRQGEKANYSNFGARVSVSAYGEEVHTLFGPNGEFGDFGGTSAAVPQVAATVAMMLEVNPRLTPVQVKQLLVESRVEDPKTKEVGGLLNVLAAVQKAKEFHGEDVKEGETEEFADSLRAILASE
ncbi:MAG: S8 family serine peptidase [Deltaproteobacteria bacterium]|nr:S8 family serine peptidase [Deltaproteobacteria bacterium]MBI3293902.1 S8 family serine peptidase [Deltaproteobacteria bacterium]